MTDTVDKIIIQSETQGVQQSTNDVQGLTKAMDGVTVASQSVEKSTGSLDSKFASLGRRFGSTSSNAAQLEKIQTTLNTAVAANPALQNEANEIWEKATARYGTAAAATKVLADAHVGLNAQGQAALHFVRSFTEQVALGVSPIQAATAGLNHLTFATTGEGGLAGAFRQVGSLIGSLVTPTTAVIAGTVALAAAAAAVAVQYDKVSVSAQRAISGAGQRTGTSVSDINTFTSQNSGLSGTSLSSKEARGLAEDLTRTGEIVISRLLGMSDAVVGFSNQTGKSLDEARKDFVGFAVDPQKALDTLSQTYGSFDVSTRKAVDALVLADDKTGAFQVIIDALSDKSKAAAGNMGVLEKATRGFINVLATETTKPVGIDQQLENVRAKLNTAIESAPDMLNTGEASQNVERLSKEFADLQQAMEKVKAANASAEFNKLSTAADKADQAILPQIAQLELVKAKIEDLNRAQAAGASSKYGANIDQAALAALQLQKQEIQDSLDTETRRVAVVSQLRDAYGGVTTQTALTLSSLQDQLSIASQRTVQGQIQAQEQAQINALLTQGVSAEEAASIASAQRAVSEEKVYQNMQKAVDASRDQVALYATQGTAEQASVKAAIAYRNAIDAGADSTQAGIIAINTARVATAQWADQAQRAAEAFENAARAAQDAKFSDPGGSFGSFTLKGTESTSTSTAGFMIQSLYNQIKGGTAQNLSQLIDSNLASGGGIDSALAFAKGQQAGNQSVALINVPGVTTGPVPFSTFGLSDITTKQAVSESDIISSVDSLYSLKNSQTSDKAAQAANLNDELAWLQSRPDSIARDQKIASLQQSIDQLKTSTDSLNSTNQDLLSPYYTQDPRTSHIGFRSQGMATGGDITVPGGYSANDNYLAQIPVASGETISVRRPGQNLGGTTQNTYQLGGIHITVQGGANVDTNALGITVYQQAQRAMRQLQASGK